MKHKMSSRGTLNEGHEPSRSVEAEGPCPESEETDAEIKENRESEDQLENPEQISECEKAERGQNVPDVGGESLKLLSDETGGPGKGSAFSDDTEEEILGNNHEYTEDEQDGN